MASEMLCRRKDVDRGISCTNAMRRPRSLIRSRASSPTLQTFRWLLEWSRYEEADRNIYFVSSILQRQRQHQQIHLKIERVIAQTCLGRLHPTLGIGLCAKGRMWCHLVVFLEFTNPAAHESRGHRHCWRFVPRCRWYDCGGNEDCGMLSHDGHRLKLPHHRLMYKLMCAGGQEVFKIQSWNFTGTTPRKRSWRGWRFYRGVNNKELITEKT